MKLLVKILSRIQDTNISTGKYCADIQLHLIQLFGSVKEPKESLCLFVSPSGPSLSKALNLQLSLIGQSQVSLRSVSDQSQVSLTVISWDWGYFLFSIL